MIVRVINASENFKQPAGQIAMLCKSNLRIATCIEQLIGWADDLGFNQLKWEIVNPLKIRLVFQDSGGGAAFEITTE